MGKTSGGVRDHGGKKVAPKAGLSTNTEKFIDAIQSGKYKKMSRSAQMKMIEKVKAENKALDLPMNFTSKEEAALSKYTSSGYLKINGELRSGKLSAETRSTVKTIDSIMKKNVLKHDVIVFRGTDGSYTTDKAYQSTSTSAWSSYTFTKGNNLHAYRIPKGTNAVYVGGGENELILPRGFDLNKYKIK